MKKTYLTQRKHGARARQLQAALPGSRLTTQLTFESSCQSYLWVMDRGAAARRRSRLIKH